MVRACDTTGEHEAGCSNRSSSKTATSEEVRRTLRYVEPLSEARTKLADCFSILLGFICGFSCELKSMNPPIFQWDIQRLIDQTMPIQQILPCEGCRDHHHLEMIHHPSPVRDRHSGIRHRLAQIIRQNFRRNHGLSQL